MRRTIKRYDNRKLYDLEAKRYVRLSDLAQMIRSGDDVVVIDNATGTDLTEQTLAKILSDKDAWRSFLPGRSLLDLVRRGRGFIGDTRNDVEHWFGSFFSGSVERAAATQEIRRELTDLRMLVAKLESLILELERENGDAGNNNGSDRSDRSGDDGDPGG